MATRPAPGGGGGGGGPLSVPAGTLAIKAAADTEQLERQLKRDIPRMAEQGGHEAGQGFQQSFIRSVSEQQATGSIEKIVDQQINELQEQFETGMAQARLDLERGMISEEGFRDVARLNAREFNNELMARLEGLEDRFGDLVSEDIRQRVAAEMKETGRQGGEELGEGADEAARNRLEQLVGWMRTGFRGAIVGAVAIVFSRIVHMARQAARRIRQTLERAGEFQQIREGFEQITQQQGLDPERTLEELRAGTRGTTRELDLMRQTNEALLAGIQANEEELGEMARLARRLGRAVGRDATDALDRFIRASVRGRRQILDDIGVIVDFEQAHQRLATELGKSTDELTEQERVQARLNETLRVARQRVEDLGPETLTAGERVDQLTTFLENFLDASAVAIATTPKVEGALGRLGDTAEEIAESFERLERTIGATVDLLAELAFDPLENLEALSPGPAGAMERARLMGQFVRRRRQNQELRQIRRSQDTDELEERRVELNERLEDLRRQQIQDEERSEQLARARLDLEERLGAVRRRIIELGTSDGDSPEMTLSEAREAAANLEEELENVRVVGTDLAEVLKQSEDHLGGLLEDTRDLADESGRRRGPGGMLVLGEDEAEIQRLAKLARRLEEINRTAESEEEALRQAQAAMDRHQVSVDELKDSSAALADTVMRELLVALPEWAEELLGIDDNSDDAEDSTRSLADEVKNLAQLAGGVLSLADAFGIFGDEASDALQKGVTSVNQLVQGIESAQNLAADASLLAQAGPAGAIAGGAAGLFSAFSQLFADDQEAIRRQREIREESQRLTLALNELRRSAEAVRQVFESVSGADITVFKELLEGLDIEEFRGPRAGEFRDFPLRDALAEAGLTMEDFLEFARGLEVVDASELIEFLETGQIPEGIRGRAGAIFLEQMEAIIEAAETLELSEAVAGFQTQMSLLREEFELLDIEDPIEQLRRMREVLLGLETDLPPALEEALTGADLSTEEGRRRVEEVIGQLIRQLAAGQLTSEDLRGLTLDQFRELLGNLEETLDEAAEEEEGQTGGFQQTRGITEVTANRITGRLTTLDVRAMKRNEILGRILTQLGGTVPANVGPQVAPSTASAAADGRRAGVHVAGDLVGSMTVEIPAGLADQLEGEDGPEQLADRISERFLRRVDRGLGRLRTDRGR